MKNIIYLILLWGCNQDNKMTSILYEIEVINKESIEMKILNNTNQNYFFVHPKLYFIKTSNRNKNILTEDIITEIKYNYNDLIVPDNKKSNLLIVKNDTMQNCNSFFLLLKKGENIKLKYNIENSGDLSPGNYSIIRNNLNCNANLIGNKIPKEYLDYIDSLSIPYEVVIY